MRYSKNQLNAYRGVLKNKNLAKVMEEGLTAAVGSTKRKRAQKMLSILKKTTVDGQGGPGPRSVPRVNVRLRPSTIDYSNLLILPAAPKIRVPFGEKAPTPRPEHDGQGYPGPMDGKGFLGFGGSTAPVAPSVLNLRTAAPAAGLVIPPYGSAIANTGKLMGGLKAAGSLATGPWGMGLTAASYAVPEIGKNVVWGMQDRLVNHEADPAYKTANSTVPYQEVLPKGQTATGNRAGAATAAATAAAAKPVMWGDKQIGGKSLKDYSIEWAGGTPSNTYNGQDVSGMPLKDFSMLMSGMTPGSDPLTEPVGTISKVQQAVNDNLGPTTFAYNSLKEDGGGLYERFAKIEEASRKSYGLDQMQDQLNSMIVSGNTLGGRLTDYIRGRDEFLNETEDMIGDLKKRSMKMDMSDPRTRANTQQHFNYLYEMRGRQNKRYVEFMDQSINEYNGRVEAAKTVYDTQFNRYEAEVLKNQNIAKEEYTMLFTGLQEMYNTVAGAEMAQMEKELMEHQVNAAYYQTIKDGADVSSFNSGDPIQLDKDLKQKGVINSNGAWVPNNGAIDYSGVNVYQLANAMSDAVGNAMYTYDEKGNRGGAANKDDALRTAQNALMVLDVLNRDGILTGESYAQHQQAIKGHLTRALEANQTFINTEEQLPSYRKAIESLAGDSFWGWGRKTPTKEQFIKKWGPEGQKLDSGILNTIYANLEASTSAGETARSYVDTFLTGRGDFAQEGEAIDSDAVLRRNLIFDYMQRLQPAAIAPGLSFNKVGGGTNSASIAKAAQAIKNVESSGGNYRALGPAANASGDRAYGAYQVMGANIPSWTQAALGYSMTPAQFLNDPAAQDAVFAHIFGGYVKQYGTVEDAASAWFSGRPIAKAGNSKDVLGTSVPVYVQKFQNSYYS